jgi:RNA polymerase sigma factor (TIGR02999 family)
MPQGQTREMYGKDAMRGDATRGPPHDARVARDPPPAPDTHERAILEALDALRRGAPEAMTHLVPLVYEELKGIAHRQLRAEAGGHTLSTTALVHEAWLRLSAQSRAEWVGRGQFFAIAARTIRRVLVDYARRHDAGRRGGPRGAPVALELLERLDASALAVGERAESLLALDEALERLQRMDDRLARVVECRFFAGLSELETSEALGVSHRTVARDWRMARAWLHDALRDDAR